MSKFYKYCFLNLLVLGVAVIGTTSPVQASDSQPPLPPYVQRLVNGGAQVKYLGDDLGLQGWMLVKDAQRQYIYVTPNQEAYLLGLLLNSDGEMVTKEQLERFVDKNPAYLQDQIKDMVAQSKKEIEAQKSTKAEPVNNTPKIAQVAKAPQPVETHTHNPATEPQTSNSKSPAEELLSEIQNSNWVEIGSSSAPIVYAFIDPECQHCHQFIQDLRDVKAFEEGKIRTRLMPVGIMGRDSLYEAGTLIDSKDPKNVFFNHIDGDEFALPVDTKQNTQKVQENMKIMQDWKLDVTPFIIYESKSGEIKIVRGRPKKLDEFFADLK